jgi:hypothetical protein
MEQGAKAVKGLVNTKPDPLNKWTGFFVLGPKDPTDSQGGTPLILIVLLRGAPARL